MKKIIFILLAFLFIGCGGESPVRIVDTESFDTEDSEVITNEEESDTVNTTVEESDSINETDSVDTEIYDRKWTCLICK